MYTRFVGKTNSQQPGPNLPRLPGQTWHRSSFLMRVHDLAVEIGVAVRADDKTAAKTKAKGRGKKILFRGRRSVKQTPHRRVPVHSLARLPSRRTRFAINVGLKEIAINPQLNIIVRSESRHSAGCVQCLPSLVLKPDFSCGSLLTNKTSLVNQVVVMPAQHDQIIQTRFAAIGPVLNMVSIDKTGIGTARKATAFVSCA